MKKRQLKVINPVPDVSLFTISLITQGFQQKKWKKFLGFYFEETFAAYQNNFVDWHVDFLFWKKFGQAVFDKVYKDKKFPRLIYKKHKKLGQAIYQQCDKVLKSDISKLSNKKILTILKKLFFDLKDICFWGITPVVVDFENNLLSGWLEKKIIESSAKYQLKEAPSELMTILNTPIELVFSQKEKIDLLKLASQKNLKDEDIEKHHFLYNWVDYGYIGPTHPLSFYKKKIASFKKGKKRPTRLLRDMIKERKKIKTNQQKFSKKLYLDAKTKYLFQVARDFMFLKVYRKEIMFKAYYTFDCLFKEIGKRFDFTKTQLHYCLPEEIMAILENKKIPENEINKRIKSYFVHSYRQGKNYFYCGKEARKIIKENLFKEKIDKSIREIKGMTAFLGRVEGVVKIVNKVSEMKKVKRGDILISIATSPNILPAMKLAAAFITDTGGITCHAAIVAREMKKPCVIGTKVATKVFKDGDKVVVDATKGIVGKLDQ